MKRQWVMLMSGLVLLFSGCATMRENQVMDADSTAQAFFDRLQRSDTQGAYTLLAKGISQRISYDQFDQFMQTIREQWGRIESEETAVMPFHKRIGESEFIPLDSVPQKIKRYVYNVKFQNAEMNFDLTLAPQGNEYKIVWFSIWGSSIYLSTKIREKIEELFANPDQS